MRALVEAALMPPLNCLVLAAVGFVLRRRRRKLGGALMVAAAVLLWLQSTPYVATALLCSLQTAPALAPEPAAAGAQAIVVLSADMTRRADELGGPTPAAFGLERLRYGAWLQRATGLPLLVSGGVPARGYPSHAETMKQSLERSFGVPVRWVETASGDTHQNARESARILGGDGVRRVYLVTHAWHMPRARRACEAAGLAVFPAATGFRTYPDNVLSGLLPRWTAVRDSALAWHEYLGLLWYEVAYY